MAVPVGGRSDSSGQARRLLAAAAVTLLTAATFAASALAMPTGPDSVRPGKNVTVFHDSDFVAVFGHRVGEQLTVDVYRGPHRIASAFGPAVSTPEGGGLEVNHGPEGAAVQGDCWDGHTPDILPGDRVVVTDGSGGKDEVFVDDIAITNGPIDDTSTADTTDVILEGRASFADGTPIPVERLDSGELRHDGPRFRATPNTVERIPGTADGWRATYRHPYTVVQIKEALTAQERKQAILDGDHAMGYGHAVPLPSETQIAERPAPGGPALDCGNPASPFYAPKQANAVTTSDDRFVNLGSGDLTLGGTAAADVTAVGVTLSDGDATTADITVHAAGLTDGPGEKGWSAEFTRAQIEDLADGPLTATGAYQTPDGSATGAAKEILKDTLEPAAPTATPEPKLYNRAQNVSLRAEDGAGILYTLAPSPAPPTTRYTGPISVDASASLRAIVVDRAGNPGPEASFDYTIDTVAPNIDVDLDAASDSGSSDSDNLTNVASPTFRGTTEAGAKVELLLDGTKKGETTAGSDGSYALQATNPAAGNRSVVARATDPAGNAQSSAPLVVRIDRADPSVRGAPAPGTYDTARQVRLAANEEADIFYTLGAADPTPGSTRFTTPISIASSRTIKALAVDRAGNVGGVSSLSYTIRRDSFVNLRLSTADLTLGGIRAISGKVSPAHAGARIEINITRDGAPFATRYMRLDGQSDFATYYRPPTTGRYRVTVVFPGDVDSKPSSATGSFRVVW